MPIDPHDVQKLFLRVVELPPADWSAALDRECGSDVALRQRVEGLLNAHEESDSLLDRSSDRFDATVLSDADNAAHTNAAEDAAEDRLQRRGSKRSGSPETAETHIREESIAGAVIADRYTMVQRIGEGGMGEVWMAKQTSPVKRKVALKLIKMGMDSKAVLARFDQERQALALMDHPNIAKVLDGGITPTGQPFFVMELVNGLPLNKFCDEARLDTNGRLELFVSICQAIQHAHQKGIVHRDLKPANILVTLIDGRPVPKVIDFGVAKATSGKLTDESLSTQFGAVVGTLEYMSPEQAGFSGEDIDTRADIYSLGVILYELLTGLRPIDAQRLKKAALTEMIRIVREEEPSRPSTRLSTDASLPSMAALRQTDPKKLMALLRGELDWVVMKCLEKQRDRRYETANALARDVQRYLADEAVEARPPSTGYRLSKFFKRNRGPVIAASLILMAVVAGIFGTTVGLIRADQAQSREAVVATAREQLARVEYGRTMEMAYQQWRDNNVSAARTLLQGTRPDLRGWEWQYVHRLCHSDLVTLGGYPTSPSSTASFSPDGLRIVTAGGDNTARVWDTQTGALVNTLKGHADHVPSATFSSDGSLILTPSYDRTANVWDAQTGALVLTLKGHSGSVSWASFSPDCSQILTVGEGSAKVWDAKSGVELYTLQGIKSYDAASFSPDSSRILTVSNDDAVKVWDAKTGAEVLQLKGHSDSVYSAQFSPDGSRIVTVSNDKTAKVWNAATGAVVVAFSGHTDLVFSARFSPDGSRIVTVSVDKTAKLWNATTGDEVVTLVGHTGVITSASFSPDGARIVTTGRDKTAKVWEASTGTQVFQLKGHTAPVLSASFSPDSSRILTTSYRTTGHGADASAKVWDSKNGKDVLTFNNAQVTSVSFNQDGTRIVISSTNTVGVLDARTGAEIVTLKAGGSEKKHFGLLPNYHWYPSASFSPDGTRIVAVGVYGRDSDLWDGMVRVWDAQTGTLVLALKEQTAHVLSASFSPDGSRIVTAGADSIARVWDAQTGAQLLTLNGHSALVCSSSFSPDGTRILTASQDKTARVWDATTGFLLLTLKLEGDDQALFSASFSPDSLQIVTTVTASGNAATYDNTATVWNARTGAETARLKHTAPVYTASFSPDGARIVTAGADRTAIVWDAKTGVQLLTLNGHTELVVSARFSLDGSRIITAAGDNTLKLWDATPINREFLTSAAAIDSGHGKSLDPILK